MADTDIAQTTQTDLKGTVSDFRVDPVTPEGVETSKETTYDYPDFTKYFGYYKTIPELKQSIDALANWSVGKGFETPSKLNKVILRRITGWGEDTFDSILWNLMVTKKVNGDAFAEIIRNDKGTLINLKTLDPSVMRVVVDEKGIVKRYEQRSKTNAKAETKKFKPSEILHLVNDRVADEIHGTSVVESVQWVIDARNESMSDWRRVLHRSTIRVIEVDTDDTTKLSTIKRQYAEAIKNGEVLLVPKDNYSFPDAPINFIDPQAWIKYLEDFFYQAVGVPKVILGGSSEFTEASSKIAYVTFEQVYTKEQSELEKDLFNQLGIEIKFNKPVSLTSEAITAEDKNKAQTGFQPNDTNVRSGKSNPETVNAT